MGLDSKQPDTQAEAAGDVHEQDARPDDPHSKLQPGSRLADARMSHLDLVIVLQ
jgi:hypothetical protein